MKSVAQAGFGQSKKARGEVLDIRSAVISIGQALGFDKVRISSVSTGKDTEFVHEWLGKALREKWLI